MLWASDPKLLMLSTNRADDLSLANTQQQQKHQTPRTNMHTGIAQNPMHLAEHSCPGKDSTCQLCGRIGHWDIRCQSISSKQKDPNKKPPRCGPKGGKQKQTHTVDVGDDYDPQCNEVHVITIDVHPHHSA